MGKHFIMEKFDKKEGLNAQKRSIIGSLLSEISWEGSKVTRYRNGGQGLENVLTSEVFQILYFLPRTHFLGEIVKNLHTKNALAIDKLVNEIEQSEFDLFPGNYYLIEEPLSHQKGMAVQPDSLLISDSVYTLIEVKRIRRSSFQKEQLAREFYLVCREAKNKMPLLLLIIPKEPPVSIAGGGKKNIVEHIKETLKKVYLQADSSVLSLEELTSLVENHVAWITWEEIYNLVKKQVLNYDSNNHSEKNSVERLCNALLEAIERHS